MRSESEKMRPFSHLPGSSTLLPKSSLVVEAFPAFLRLQEGEKTIAIRWKFSEAMDNFTIFQDLDRGEVEVSGRIGKSFLRYFLSAHEKNVRLFVEKAPKEGIEMELSSSLSFSKKSRIFSHHEEFFPLSSFCFSSPSRERIFLGSHKKQEAEGILRRNDLQELLPLWFALSQWFDTPSDRREGLALFLNQLEERKAHKDRLGLEKDLKLLCRACFSSLFVPQLKDGQHLGPFEELALSKEASSLTLLKQGGTLIRSLFLQQEKEKIFLLPVLPPSLISGHLAQMDLADIGKLDLEWRNSLPRKACLFSKAKRKIFLLCPSEIHSFRMRKTQKERGEKIQAGTSLEVEADTIYLFDHFEK